MRLTSKLNESFGNDHGYCQCADPAAGLQARR
jgi:hypothetical protein